MRSLVRACLWFSALMFAGAMAQAAPYAASGFVNDSVTVSGSWSSVNWYESDGCYSGVGDPSVSDWKTRAEGALPIDLTTNASDTYGLANSHLVVSASGLIPAIVINSLSDVHGVPSGLGHWASAYSQGGANWLTSGATQTVTYTVDYSYGLDLTQVNPNNPYAFVKIYVAFWGPSGNLMLAPDAEFAAEGNYLVKTMRIDTHGSQTGTITGTKSWNLDVSAGAFYSFWNMAWTEVFTSSTPVSADPASWSVIKSLFK